jgi:hypothetical protein
MLQLKNTTPFAANMLLLPDEDGIESLYVNVKATFKIGQQWTLAEAQEPPQEADEYWGEPGESSLKYASDFHLGKPATDIVMLGEACARDGNEVRQLDVMLSVANVSKTVRVFGDRVWDNGRVSNPEPFETMPLVYERAYGGSVEADGEITEADSRNPVGVGFRGDRKGDDINGQPLPNLEEPNNLIRAPGDKPAPACFGFLAPSWQPRAGYAGTYDECWQQTRAPYLPSDFDRRFFNGAPLELVYGGFLLGGEPVEITNMHPGGDLRFSLPYIKLVAHANVNGSPRGLNFNLETLRLEPNELKAVFVWKAKMRCDKKAFSVSEIKISLSR